MGTYLLRGITMALLVTVITLFAGMVWGAMGLGGLSASRLLDIGLLASCLVSGYRTAKESGEWWMGGAAGAGYVAVGTLLLSLFLPIRGWGFLQILAEGAFIGLVAGGVGVGGAKEAVSGAWPGRPSRSYFKPSYEGGGSDDCVSSEFNPSSIWLERTQGEPQGTRGTKRDPEEGSDVEWSWDREDDKFISLGSGNSEPLIAWEPERVRTKNVVKNKEFEINRANQKNTNDCKERDTKPWWEE